MTSRRRTEKATDSQWNSRCCNAWFGSPAALLTVLAGAPVGAVGEWRKAGDDARSGVSGLAYEGRTAGGAGVRALVVHDNKRSGQQRLSRLTHRAGSDGVAPITWNGPETRRSGSHRGHSGDAGEYLALASRGIVYRLKVTGSAAEVLDYSPLPGIGEGDDFESFALVAREGKLAALWADREPVPNATPRHAVRGAADVRSLGAAAVRRSDAPGLSGGVPDR